MSTLNFTISAIMKNIIMTNSFEFIMRTLCRYVENLCKKLWISTRVNYEIHFRLNKLFISGKKIFLLHLVQKRFEKNSSRHLYPHTSLLLGVHNLFRQCFEEVRVYIRISLHFCLLRYLTDKMTILYHRKNSLKCS